MANEIDALLQETRESAQTTFRKNTNINDPAI
jgi:hypothetical protein